MSVFQRVGEEVLLHVAKQEYIDRRRRAVDRAWANYRGTCIEREERGEPDPYRYGFEELSYQTDAFVRREAARWAKTSRNYRVYEDDFESQFRFIVVKAALRYDGMDGTFFDYLRGAIANAGRDMVRMAKRKKRRINHTARSLDVENVLKLAERCREVPSAEQEALLRMTIEDIFEDPDLSHQEYELLQFLRTCPDATLDEIAKTIEVRDRKQASRVRQRLARKLVKHLEQEAIT
ncbi:hypothetical protein [Paenibacillus soyae]|uniref:Sigma-70 family RNA polymerase sigma factor n=1 Tax=Paenibacillus soyae TaxID=2969249 RepID=A0A9X2S9N4_9BACL|nr:hypothetical protein [Paenibacillus soyae]MCR2805326.1 hypothetical protein [Paenibacillus soyae]